MLTATKIRIPLPHTTNEKRSHAIMAALGIASDAPVVAKRREAHEYARRILLVVAGLTPQVVTETLYALTRGATSCGEIPYNPTELWIATTSAGRREVERSLMDLGDNQVGRLCEAYDLPVPVFGDSHLLSLTDERGNPLEDAHDDAAFLALGDVLTSRLAEWTEDPDSAIHLSLAGGRKTMGYLAGHALSLLGRPQDRLSHVLVDSPFERIAEFFYPPPSPRMAVARFDDGREELVDLSQAEVKLAYVPFLRMREILPPVLLDQAKILPFSEIVDRAQLSLDRPVVQIDTRELRMTCGGVAVHLPEENSALYYALAKRREAGITPRAETDEEVDLYLDCYEHVLPGGRETVSRGRGQRHAKIIVKERNWFALGHSGQRLPIGATPNARQKKQLFDNRASEFSEMVTRCNKEIDAALGPYLAPRYRIIGVPPKKAKQYVLPEDLVVEFSDERNRREI